MSEEVLIHLNYQATDNEVTSEVIDLALFIVSHSGHDEDELAQQFPPEAIVELLKEFHRDDACCPVDEIAYLVRQELHKRGC